MNNVIKLKNKNDQLQSEKKWGKQVMRVGFNILPSLLFKAQKRLGLTSQQMMVLLHLSDYWWDANNKPWPAVGTIADRMGLQRRQIQRIVKDLETAGLVKRIARTAKHKGKLSNEYDLSGLVKKLKNIAPEFIKAEQDAKDIKKAVTKPKKFQNLEKKENNHE